MILALVLVPFIAGILAFIIRKDSLRRVLLVVSSLIHLGLAMSACFFHPEPALRNWYAIDALGILFLTITSVLFCGAALYAVHYLKQEGNGRQDALEEGFLFPNAPEAVFTGCLLIFLASMTLAIVSQHLAILWVAMEATTLASAPLICFHRHARSLEATWKYLLICSVGIALALLGNLFLAVAASGRSSLLLNDLIRHGAFINTAWMKAAFLFLFVGYGTKMGLAPFHTWLPDAHSEAPSVVSALLSGALLNCAFLGMLRGYQVCMSAGLAGFCKELFILFGIISMIFAALFILGQTDYKRLLAYSSVEHMGIMVLGVGLGGGAVWGAMLHVLNHSLTKAGLFFTAGNILSAYRTKIGTDVRGVLKVRRASGVLWIAGFLAITGVPPFGLFLSKFVILKAALGQEHYVLAGVFLTVLTVIFIGAARVFIPMAQGNCPENLKLRLDAESRFRIVPTVVFFVLVLLMGVYIPPVLNQALQQAAQLLGGS